MNEYDDLYRRVLAYKPVADWPPWRTFDEARPNARRHVARLVASLHVHVADPTHDRGMRTADARARQGAAAEALERLCYDAARTRCAELAAWRIK